MKSNIMLLLMIPIVAFYSCNKKQPPIPVSQIIDYCPEKYIANSSPFYDTLYKGEIIPYSPVGPFFYYMEDFVFESLTTNPNNPFQIAFSRINSEDLNNEANLNYEICMYDFCSNQLEVLFSQGNSAGFLDWSVNNELIFQDNNQFKLYKFSNGQYDLISVNGFSPKFSPDGSKIVFQNIGGCQIYELNSAELVEVIVLSNNTVNWFSDNELIYGTNNGVSIYDLQTQQHQQLASLSGVGQITLRNNRTHIITDVGLYRLENGNLDLIENYYQTYGGSNPHYLTDDWCVKIRYVRDTTDASNSQFVKHYSTLNIFNTIEERTINLPE